MKQRARRLSGVKMRKHPNSKNSIKQNYKNLSCPNCNSKNIIKRGFRKTQNRGKLQRYSCKSCNYRFTENNGFFRMRNSPQKITLCLDLFFRGVSTRKIQEHLQAFYPQNSSWVSIYSWVVKYPNMISKFTDKINLNPGSEIQVDEMEFKTKGKQSWFVDIIDTKTRFMVYSTYVKARDKKEFKKMFNLVNNKTNGNIDKVTTDGFKLYTNIVKKSFGYDNKLRRYRIEHNIVNASRGEGFNCPIERLHNSIRERTKIFREFKSLEGAKAIMKGYEIFYNFIRKHQALGKCPYELATDLKLKGNKWLELIKLSKRFVNL